MGGLGSLWKGTGRSPVLGLVGLQGGIVHPGVGRIRGIKIPSKSQWGRQTWLQGWGNCLGFLALELCSEPIQKFAGSG